jgi:Ca2+-binding RTX toxin-like protein
MMVGDTYYMYQGDKGGADVITGGGLGSENLLVGDAFQATGAVGGADRLVSGAGDDQMYGDFMMNDGTSKGGADVFVFGPDNGNDVIMDFQSGIDHIDLSAFGGFRSMPHTYRALVNSDRVEEQDGAVVIHLDVNDPTSDANTLTIVGVTMRDLQSTFYF